jgi:hypothetical protein
VRTCGAERPRVDNAGRFVETDAEKIIQAMQSNWKALKPDLTGAVAGPYVGQRVGIPLHSVVANFYRRTT